MTSSRTLLSLLALVGVVACSRSEPTASTTPTAPTTPTTPTTPTDATESADIQPVYSSNVAPDPRATALCTALFGLPSTRKASCCAEAPAATGAATVAATVVAPCAGSLTAALTLGDVALDDGKAGACIAARTAQLEGCSWVGAVSPSPPLACQGLLSGTLDDGARCRSSLACKPGLRCVGGSTLDVGRCARPLPAGARCGGGVDGLAVVLGQTQIDAEHPECAGACVLGKCQVPARAGSPCRADLECGAANRCMDGSCVDGRLPLGAPCGRGGCVDGARCLEGRCQALRKDGEACRVEFDCERGGCIKPVGSETGTCGMRCTTWHDVQR